MSICDLCQLSSPSGCTKLDNEVCLKEALKLIKATATNGDVIKALFPNITISSFNGKTETSLDKHTDFRTDWWNSPYKVGDDNAR